jgi:hypothetical protein
MNETKRNEQHGFYQRSSDVCKFTGLLKCVPLSVDVNWNTRGMRSGANLPAQQVHERHGQPSEDDTQDGACCPG